MRSNASSSMPGTTAPQMLRRLTEDGLLTFRGVESRERLIGMARGLGEVRHHVHGEADGVTAISPIPESDGPSSAGFSSADLKLHTDGTSLLLPPTLVIITCAEAAAAGGTTLLADAAAAHRDLARVAPKALAALSAPGRARFGTERALPSAVFSTLPGTDRLLVRFRDDDEVRYSPDAEKALTLFRSVLGSRSYAFDLRPGDGYILQNGRWLHGRTAFSGPRAMLRVLCDPAAHELAIGFAAHTPHAA